jgi:tetratricopeptide (TPR) repeat protein
MVCVALLAFLLGSFPARNSDVWLHLAAGRSLAEAPNPFTPEARHSPDPRVTPAWLHDLLCFALYSALGGPGLVLCKALLVAGLALLLVRLSQTGPGLWLPAVCTVLALLAMSTRLLLQPATLSYFLLGLALWLVRPRSAAGAPGPMPSASLPPRLRTWLPPWPLLILFFFWVNLDSWFVLGLATVALVWLGQFLDFALRPAGETPRPEQPPLPLLALRLLVHLSLLGAVCLLNPAHLNAFAPPAELNWFGGASAAGHPVTSPFEGAYLTNAGLGPVRLAYYPLLVLGALSFLLNLPRWHWQRFLPWFGLALLSIFQVRTVPFFAVLAGPVLAWNLQEIADCRLQIANWKYKSAICNLQSAITLVLGLALLVCAWPGWLQSPPYEPRRWAIETPPSLEQGAAATRRWLEGNKHGPRLRGVHLAPETVHAFAWFCPEEKAPLNEGLASAILGDPEAPADWAGQLRAARINHLIVYAPRRGNLSALLTRLLLDPEQWPLLHLAGNLAVFGWRDPASAEGRRRFRGEELDSNLLTDRPSRDPWGTHRAPRARPSEEPRPRRWWDAFWEPVSPRPIDGDEAAFHLHRAEALGQLALYRHLVAWKANQLAGLIGAAGGPFCWPGRLLDAQVRLVLLEPRAPEQGAAEDTLPILDRAARTYQGEFARQRDATPGALLYRAVRAARRALAVNPSDAQVHLVLGKSYLRLLHDTRERAWAARFPQLRQLRQVQASVALNHAVALQPGLAEAHLHLGRLYREMGCLDLALKHLRICHRLVRQKGPEPGVSAEEYRAQEAEDEEKLSQLASEVEDQENSFATASAGMKVQDRALLAVRKGLAARARDLLLDSDVAAFGSRGMELELELLLKTGRSRDVREWTSPEQKAALGAPSYHWLRAQALAAAGDYALAGEELVQLGQGGRRSSTEGPRESMAGVIGLAIMDTPTRPSTVPHLIWRALRRAELGVHVREFARALQREANATVLRGLLALEEGDLEEAEVAFRLALELWQDEAHAASGGGLEFSGRVTAQGCLDWLQSSRAPAGTTRQAKRNGQPSK